MYSMLEVRLNARTLGIVLILVTSLCDVSRGHVSLRYPQARPLALDFLDNFRTTSPCGEPRGNGPVTDIESESNITVNWYLGYAHTGGYKIEILTYNSTGHFSVAHTLTGEANQYVGGGNITTQEYEVTLPKNFTCSNCTIRLIRQALNWGATYLFWSCADVNIVQNSRINCSGHGSKFPNGSCVCDHRFYGDICQFEDECSNNTDCGAPNGECKFVSVNAVPRHQCFCRPGYFGLKCEKESPLKSAVYNESMYISRSISSNLTVLYRILPESEEVEIVLRAKTTSYVGFGWKPTATACKAGPSAEPEGEPEGTSEPEGEPEGSPKPEGEPEGSPQPEGEPEGTAKPEGEPEGSSQPEGEPEGTATPEGEPEGSAKPEGSPQPEGEPEGEPTGDGTQNFPDGSDYTGEMDCTDIVIGKVMDGLHQVRDFYTRDRSTPRLDEFYGGTQGLTAAVAQEIDGVTTVIFRKPYKALETQDHSMVNADMAVIWAHGQPSSQTAYGSFYAQDDLKYHGANRGSAAINFFATPTVDKVESYSYPSGCVGDACEYSASWSLNEATDIITFTIKASQSEDKWTGIGIGKYQQMSDMDVILGFISSNGSGIVADSWISGRYIPPHTDATQNLNTSEIKYINGTVTLTFSRLRDTGDSQDWAFNNTQCYYFMFPVGGGSVSNNWISKHTITPHISTDMICISSSDQSTIVPSVNTTIVPSVNTTTVPSVNTTASPSISPVPSNETEIPGVIPTAGGPIFVETANGGYQVPSGCVGDACQYSATWTLDEPSDIITFVIKVNQSRDTWTGIGFGKTKQMKEMDVIYGFVATNDSGFIVDSWIFGLHTPPVADAKQNLGSQMARYAGVIMTLTFTRSRDTGDSQDWAFTNSDSGCYYFMFPVGGGPVMNSQIDQHTGTPRISNDMICIKNSMRGSSNRLILAPKIIALVLCVTVLITAL